MCNYEVARYSPDELEPSVIRRQVLVPVPPEEVWEALVDADRSEAWMDGRLALSDLAPGAPLEFRATDGSRWEGAVSIVRPGRYL